MIQYTRYITKHMIKYDIFWTKFNAQKLSSVLKVLEEVDVDVDVVNDTHEEKLWFYSIQYKNLLK